MKDKKTMICTLGQYDIPIVQKQPLFKVDLLDKNVALFGAPMSGKTNFIKLLIQSLHMTYTTSDERIFILDFGGALASYRDFPLVSAYFDNSNEEYVKRAFKLIEEIVKNNSKELAGQNFANYDASMVHTTFVIDNLNAFQDEPRYTAYQEKLSKICRDGLSKGVTVVFTASDTKGVMQYLSSFGQKIALELPSDKYIDIFNAKVMEIGAIPGRGFANVTIKPDGIEGTFRMNYPYELQCYYASDITDNGEYIKLLRKKFDYDFDHGLYNQKVRKYLTFSGDLTIDEYNRLRQNSKNDDIEDTKLINTSVGLDYIDFNAVNINFSETKVLGIYGKKEYGKTNLLRIILNDLFLKKKNVRYVFLDDGRKGLSEFYNKCKSLNLECEVFAETKKKMELPPLGTSDVMPSISDGFIGILDKKPSVKDKTIHKTLSSLQQFYHFINDNYMDLTWNGFSNGQLHSPVATYIYGDENADLMPSYNEEKNPIKPTVFVLQSKILYLSANGEKQFINNILPKLAAIAEEEDLIFIFTDIQKITDQETNNFFNNTLNAVFLLDNVAEFASERGQKTVFGNMDAKALKEEYARCEKGDGYYYDIDADKLTKLKFIKTEE